jgi:hypothetical protein
MGDTIDDFFQTKVMKLMAGTFVVKYFYDEAREIVADDPIDIPRLQTVLREGLGAVKNVRKLRPGKSIQKNLDSCEKYFKNLLSEIVGQQH